MENKSTKAEIERRVQIVYEMLCTGYSRKKIISVVNNETGTMRWDVSDRQIDTYIKAASKAIDEITEKNFERCYKNTKSRLNYCYQKLAEKKDYKGAIMALKELSELDGLKIQKIAPVTPDGEKYEQSIDVTKLSTETLLELANASRKD